MLRGPRRSARRSAPRPRRPRAALDQHGDRDVVAERDEPRVRRRRVPCRTRRCRSCPPARRARRPARCPCRSVTTSRISAAQRRQLAATSAAPGGLRVARRPAAARASGPRRPWRRRPPSTAGWRGSGPGRSSSPPGRRRRTAAATLAVGAPASPSFSGSPRPKSRRGARQVARARARSRARRTRCCTTARSPRGTGRARRAALEVAERAAADPWSSSGSRRSGRCSARAQQRRGRDDLER